MQVELTTVVQSAAASAWLCAGDEMSDIKCMEVPTMAGVSGPANSIQKPLMLPNESV